MKNVQTNPEVPHTVALAQQPIIKTPPAENIQHIITQCIAYSDIREKILQEFKHLCEQSKLKPNFDNIQKGESTLCQFILDPTSLNL
jgi:hypothetical protein